MRVYVDTEFTQFIDCDLISIGLVADDGREFYGERADYDRASCSEFVRGDLRRNPRKFRRSTL
ncbi:hypothetical protein P5X00_39880 (plasmid) [Paraburkholderia sp. A2RO-4L]|uniref:hypothetical protein n=1 Tax=Paraburkholderia sp. A2RO-4L TaxID=3028374 RepID=UPI003DA957C7